MTITAVGKAEKIHAPINTFLRCGAICCALFILMISATSFVKAAIIPVTTNVDNGDNASPVAGSLRAAIIAANATAVSDDINFSGAGIGTHTLLAPLPAITAPLEINGYTGTGATAASSNTNPATLVIEINGAGAGNSAIGFQFSAAACTTTTCRVLGLAINRFSDSGIRINSGSVSVLGNFIGTDINGTSNLCGNAPQTLCGNVNRGILIVGSTGNIIGNSTPANRNIISANSGTGISITGGGSATVVNNFIGTDKNGTADLGNAQEGIRIVDSSNSVIGGADSSARNVISGNEGSGVSIIQSSNATTATGNVISANFIGVDITGTATTIIGGFQTSPVGNSGSGVLINAGGNRVGGNRSGTATSNACTNQCNVIAGNRANGVSIGSNFGTANTISGNNIGAGPNGPSITATAIGNRDNGIQISNLAGGNTVGFTSVNSTSANFCNLTCNLIANNGDPNSTSARAGIYLDETAGTGNSFRRNAIFNNTGIGIDLGSVGANADRNDPSDADSGPNNLQNVPVVTGAFASTGLIVGTLQSAPNATFTIDIYRNNDATDTAVTSEARVYIGSTSVTTNGAGTGNFSTALGTGVIAIGNFVTATATAETAIARAPEAVAVGDTSEIADPQLVAAIPPTAATAPISGRLKTANNVGISGASVSLFDMQSGETYFVHSDANGNFVFDGVPVGATYTLTPIALGFSFNPTSKVFSLMEELTNVEFIAVRKGRFRKF